MLSHLKISCALHAVGLWSFPNLTAIGWDCDTSGKKWRRCIRPCDHITVAIAKPTSVACFLFRETGHDTSYMQTYRNCSYFFLLAQFYIRVRVWLMFICVGLAVPVGTAFSPLFFFWHWVAPRKWERNNIEKRLAKCADYHLVKLNIFGIS